MNELKILLIRMNHSYAGFFSYVTFALNQLRYAESVGLRPVVYFGPYSGDGPNAFYDPPRGDNTWDYFFEPVAGLSCHDLCARIADPHDPLVAEEVVQLAPAFLWYLHAYDPSGIYNYPYGYFRSLPAEHFEAWYSHQRARARYFLRKYVRPKAHILAQVDTFWNVRLAGHDVIGLHLRGSDKGAADAPAALSRIVEPDEYVPHIDQFLDQARDPLIFLATEQSQFVARMRERYGDLLVTREVIRTDSFGPTSNPFQSRAGSGYTKGEEVLVDCLLLARTRRLLRCTSAVGEYALYFNDQLESVNLNQLAPTKVSSRSPLPVHEYFGPGRLFEGVILINLDARTDRLERSMAELKRHDLDAFVTRLSAARHENGQYGCSLSHLEAVRYARWKGWRSLLILEDDIKLADTFARDAPPAFAEIGAAEWGIFQLGLMAEPKSCTVVSPRLVRFTHGHAAHAVALHARTFDFLIDDYVCELWRGNWDLPMHVPFDEYVNNRLTYVFPAYASRKLLVSQHPGRSDTWNREVDYRALIESSYDRLPDS